MCVIKKTRRVINYMVPVLYGFNIATFLFIFDVINERKAAALFIILRYVTAIIGGILIEEYFKYYDCFKPAVNKNSAAGFSKLTVWCKCVFFGGIIYFGLGMGTFLLLLIAYILFFANIFPSFDDVLSICVRLSVFIYWIWIIGGFAIGNVLYIKYYHAKRVNLCVIKKTRRVINYMVPVLYGFNIATFLFIFDVINERKAAALFIILRYVTAIIGGILIEEYFKYYDCFKPAVNKNSAAGFSKLTVWCKCVFFGGIIYFGLGMGTFLLLLIAYILFFANIFPSFDDVLSICVRLSVFIYWIWIIGGFAIGNVLYIKYYHARRVN